MSAILEVRHLSKAFGNNVVLKDIDFTVHAGDVTSIIGASGSGKSTLLRCINLLEIPTGGQIFFHGQDITAINASAYRAKVGMVFQSFNLFNNMNVLGNCMIGQTKVLKKSPEEARANAMKYLEGWHGVYLRQAQAAFSGQKGGYSPALAMEPEVLPSTSPQAPWTRTGGRGAGRYEGAGRRGHDHDSCYP